MSIKGLTADDIKQKIQNYKNEKEAERLQLATISYDGIIRRFVTYNTTNVEKDCMYPEVKVALEKAFQVTQLKSGDYTIALK